VTGARGIHAQNLRCGSRRRDIDDADRAVRSGIRITSWRRHDCIAHIIAREQDETARTSTTKTPALQAALRRSHRLERE
jgi:hypothetical protein